MIAIDTNVLVHAFRRDSPHHDAANRAVSERIAARRPTAIPWPCVHEFVAVTTNRRAFAQPSSASESLDAIAQLLVQDAVLPLGETPTHLATLRGLVEQSGVSGPKVHDARIAAICLDHGVVELWTADRDYSYFPRLVTRNPLVSR